MSGDLKRVSASVPFQDYIDEQMKDPEFRRVHEKHRPEFELIEQIIALRLRRQMTQAELAEHAGTSQPSIARLERRGHTKSLDFIQRVAEALGARVQIRLVPLEEEDQTAAISARTDARRQFAETSRAARISSEVVSCALTGETRPLVISQVKAFSSLGQSGAGSATNPAVLVRRLSLGRGGSMWYLDKPAARAPSLEPLVPIKLNEEAKATNV